MKHIPFLSTTSFLIYCVLLWQNGCLGEDSPNYYGQRDAEEDNKVAPSITGSYTSKQLFNILDTDRNSKITLRDFYVIDKNHDGDISWSEFSDRMGSSSSTKESNDPGGFINAFTSSTAMIIATEIGDKTFFIAAVMSMRNPRLVVFGGAIFALICMTVLSTMMGLILPSLIPRSYTHIIGGILFLYFGVKLIYDSRSMSDRVSEELEEVEEELLKTNKKSEETSADDEENATSSTKVVHAKSMNEYGILIQSFLLTFLAEWGDRSQIATIALAASKDPIGVTLGGCFGHSLCTGMAVIGGRLLASKISEKSVSRYGGLTFLAFGIHTLVFDE